MADIPTGPIAPFHLVAGPDQAGQRTDRFLADAIGTTSRSRVKLLMEAGHVLRDGTAFREAAAPVRAGMTYTVNIPQPVAARPQAQSVPFAIVHEDDDLIVLDKPPGLVVHPAPGNEDGTLVNALLAHCGDTLPGIGGERRPGIVHRLDKDTSGLMVVAKTEAALAALSDDFAARRIERAYFALCWGMLSPASGEIDGAVGRDPRDRKRMTIVARGGKPAVTRYRTLQVLHGAVSLIECRLATGRTHQIRVHLSQNGHALLGDPVYLRRVPAAARLLAKGARQAALDFPRQALHAAILGFTHPRTGQILRFETRPPADFNKLLSYITENSDT
jgi:23S rRNA pseudouridine1911/1915/1917 synthase